MDADAALWGTAPLQARGKGAKPDKQMAPQQELGQAAILKQRQTEKLAVSGAPRGYLR